MSHRCDNPVHWVFDTTGRLCATVGGTPPGTFYSAVTAGGGVFVKRDENEHSVLEAYDARGALRHTYAIPGLRNGLLTIGTDGSLLVPCERTGDIKMLSPEAQLVRRLDLGGQIIPFAVAPSEAGGLWISGQLA